MSIADSFMVQPFSVGEIIETLRDNHDSVRRIAYDLHQKPDVPKLQQEVECLSTALARNRRAYTQIETTLPSSVAKRVKIEFSDYAESLSKVSRELEELQNFPDLQRRAAKIVQESSLYLSKDDFEGVKEEIDPLSMLI